MLAIIAVFSTVATEHVCAHDVHLIKNVVYSSENTGGIRQNGQNGEDGKPGTDGTPGTSGSSITQDSKRNTSSIIESTVDGVIVLDIQKTQSSPADSSFVFATHTTTTTETLVLENFQNTTSEDASQNIFSKFSEALFSLQLMLITYVSILF